MIDREKVINALEDYEPYAREFDSLSVYGWVVLDALTLLKEHEPMRVLDVVDFTDGIEFGQCPSCKNAIANNRSNPTRYCKFCGQAVKWE